MRPGDFALERDDGIISWAIRLGTRSRWNHAKLIVSSTGRVLESMPTGAEWGFVKPTDLVYEAPLTTDQRIRIIDIAKELHGTPYGWIDVVAIGLAQFGIKIGPVKQRLEDSHSLFCSQLVDYAWLLAGFHAFSDGRLPGLVSPGDLGDLASVEDWPVLQKPDDYTFSA